MIGSKPGGMQDSGRKRACGRDVYISDDQYGAPVISVIIDSGMGLCTRPIKTGSAVEHGISMK